MNENADDKDVLASFEQAAADLEAIVARLEEGGLTLKETLDLYEQGQALAAQCEAALDAAELRLEQLGSDETPSPGSP